MGVEAGVLLEGCLPPAAAKDGFSPSFNHYVKWLGHRLAFSSPDVPMGLSGEGDMYAASFTLIPLMRFLCSTPSKITLLI